MSLALDYSGGTAGENLLACPGRGHGFSPRSGKITHAMEQQSPDATTTDLSTLEPGLHKRSLCNEKPVRHKKEQSLLAAARKSLCSLKDPE